MPAELAWQYIVTLIMIGPGTIWQGADIMIFTWHPSIAFSTDFA